jgi:mannose-6-phosphate isomerase-like protein (cupin superfamily)
MASIEQQEESVDFKPVRRVVVGHDPQGKARQGKARQGKARQGKAVALFDGKQRSPGGNGVINLWVTSEVPVRLSGTADRAEAKVGVPPPPNGSIFRIVDFPPASTSAAAAHVDHATVLVAMGIDPATQGYARHPNTHRTRSIDYAIVMEGEISMLMDDTEVHLRAGDVLIQQATNHAWVNNSASICRIAFVLVDAETPPAWQQGWKP